MSKAQDCRATAARCLASVVKGNSLSQQIPEFEARVSERDRALFRQLCYGVLRWQPKLEGLSAQLLQKPFKAKDADIHMLILLGLYQLSEMRIPDHAAVSATVNATRALKKPWAKNLVNGVLRQWQRRSEDLAQQLSPAQQLAHPQWLHLAIQQAWPEQAQAIQQANNEHPPMCLRVNSQKTQRQDYLQLLSSADIAATACDHSPVGIRLQQATAVQQLPHFAEGWVSVQDEAPQLGVALLDLQPGQRVLDMCNALGGKTCHMLEAQPELAHMLAVDIDQQRLLRVSENL